MMANEDLVSVIIPVYNGERFLAEAVESIRQQDYHSLEIIVVDDGSTDGSAAIAKSLGEDIRYFYQEHAGPSAARNLGLRQARGSLIAFLDADDLWPENKLRNQIQRLSQDPDLEVISGRVQYFGLESPVIRRMHFEGLDQTVINFSLGSAVFRKPVFEKVGDFDESLTSWEELDWFMRAKELNVRIKILKLITLKYRQHEHNYSQTQSSEHGMMVVMQKSIARRRCSKIPDAGLACFSDFDEE
jgi:glycosyltransferase involved in cell wall biosynthesis